MKGLSNKKQSRCLEMSSSLHSFVNTVSGSWYRHSLTHKKTHKSNAENVEF